MNLEVTPAKGRSGGIMQHIPLSRLRTCSYCADQIDSNEPGNFQIASGWVKVRRTGGPHLTLPVYGDRWACSNCIDRLQHGIAPGQQSIFDMFQP